MDRLISKMIDVSGPNSQEINLSYDNANIAFNGVGKLDMSDIRSPAGGTTNILSRKFTYDPAGCPSSNFSASKSGSENADKF